MHELPSKRCTIDANTIIHLVSGRYPRLARKCETVPRGEIQISTIVFAELALGAENGLAPAVEILELLVTQMPFVPFDESAARAYAKLPFRRCRLDRLLAAHAPSLNATVVSRNKCDFAGIPNLTVENWAAS